MTAKIIPFCAALALFAAPFVNAGFAVAAEQSAKTHDPSVQLGPRPHYLVGDMDESDLKQALTQCEAGPFYRTEWSIGHRGAALQFPEHTRESYVAAARMGAGIIECDVTFTADRQLVCRHAQCDLHTTTNILATGLADKCTQGFAPADPDAGTQASAKCCASDITLAEFRTLKGKMDAANRNAATVEDYMNGTTGWRTDLYSQAGTLMSHAESIALFKDLGVKMTPELKASDVEMPFDGDYTQQAYGQQMIDEYKAAGVDAGDVYAQSFNREDVLYWIANEPEFGKQAVYLDGRYSTEGFDPANAATWTPSMQAIADEGVKIIAPPLWMLVADGGNGKPVASAYAKAAKDAGLQIIAWTAERSGPLANGGGWYFQTTKAITNNDGDVMDLLDVLAKDVGVIGVFSDWPATTTYYANCMGL